MGRRAYPLEHKRAAHNARQRIYRARRLLAQSVVPKDPAVGAFTIMPLSTVAEPRRLSAELPVNIEIPHEPRNLDAGVLTTTRTPLVTDFRCSLTELPQNLHNGSNNDGDYLPTKPATISFAQYSDPILSIESLTPSTAHQNTINHCLSDHLESQYYRQQPTKSFPSNNEKIDDEAARNQLLQDLLFSLSK